MLPFSADEEVFVREQAEFFQPLLQLREYLPACALACVLQSVGNVRGRLVFFEFNNLHEISSFNKNRPFPKPGKAVTI